MESRPSTKFWSCLEMRGKYLVRSTEELRGFSSCPTTKLWPNKLKMLRWQAKDPPVPFRTKLSRVLHSSIRQTGATRSSFLTLRCRNAPTIFAKNGSSLSPFAASRQLLVRRGTDVSELRDPHARARAAGDVSHPRLLRRLALARRPVRALAAARSRCAAEDGRTAGRRFPSSAV